MTEMLRGDEPRTLLTVEYKGEVFVWPYPVQMPGSPGIHYNKVWMFSDWSHLAAQLNDAPDVLFGAWEGRHSDVTDDFIDATGGWVFERRPAEGWGPRNLETLAKIAEALSEVWHEWDREQ